MAWDKVIPSKVPHRESCSLAWIHWAIYAKTVTNNDWGLGLPRAMVWLWLPRVPYLLPLFSLSRDLRFLERKPCSKRSHISLFIIARRWKEHRFPTTEEVPFLSFSVSHAVLITSCLPLDTARTRN